MNLLCEEEMSILPDDLFQIAKDLMRNSHEEVNFRSATNRGYYSAFHAAHQVAPQADNYRSPVNPSKKSMLGHKALIDLLKNHAKTSNRHQRSPLDKTLIKIGMRLSQAYDLRIIADYRNSQKDIFSYSQANDSISHVKEVIKLCQLTGKWKKP